MSKSVINPYQQFLDEAGVPVSSGTVTFFVNTTATIDSIFSDEALTIAQANPYTLDAAGRIRGDVKYNGKKTLQLKDRNGATIRTLDDVASPNSNLASDISYTSTTTVENRLDNIDVDDYTELRALAVLQLFDGDTVTVTNAGIVGQGNIRKVTAHGLSDNGATAGTIIVLDANTYWQRAITDSEYHLSWTGATGAGGTTYEDTQINGIIAFVATEGGGTVIIPSPVDHYATNATIVMKENVDLKVSGRNMRAELRNYIKPSANVNIGIDCDGLSGYKFDNVAVDVGNMTLQKITGGTSGTVAHIYHFDTANNILIVGGVSNTAGVPDTFTAAETITSTSGWAATVSSYESDKEQITVTSPSGTLTVSPCGIQVKASLWHEMYNVQVDEVKDGVVGIKIWVDDNSVQGNFWGKWFGCGAQGTAPTVSGGVCWAIFGEHIGAKRLTTQSFYECGGLRGYLDWDIDDCGSGMTWINPNAETSSGDGFNFDGMSSGAIPTLVGGEINGNEGWGISGVSPILAINLVDGANDAGGGTGDTNDNVIHQRGNKLLSSSTRSGALAYWQADYYQHRESVITLLAADSITPEKGQFRVSGNGGAVTLTSDPQIANPVDSQPQLLVIVGGSNTNTVTFVDGQGLRLGQNRTLNSESTLVLTYSANFGDWIELAYHNKTTQTYTNNAGTTDRTLLLNASATAGNNNAVLSALITDLQSKGLVS